MNLSVQIVIWHYSEKLITGFLLLITGLCFSFCRYLHVFVITIDIVQVHVPIYNDTRIQMINNLKLQ